MYEYYIASRIIEETKEAALKPIDEAKTLLGEGYLAFDLDILSLVAEHVSEVPLQQQYLWYFETWYNSLLLTRRIKKEGL